MRHLHVPPTGALCLDVDQGIGRGAPLFGRRAAKASVIRLGLWHPGTADLSVERASPVSNFEQNWLRLPF
jgi:hypothetical protein